MNTLRHKSTFLSEKCRDIAYPATVRTQNPRREGRSFWVCCPKSPSSEKAGSQLSSIAQSCPTLCHPMDFWTPGLPVHHQLPDSLKLMSIKSVMPSNHLSLCRPLLLLPSIFPSVRIFPKESVFRIRWPRYWSFSFSISPSNEYSGLISFRIDSQVG